MTTRGMRSCQTMVVTSLCTWGWNSAARMVAGAMLLPPARRLTPHASSVNARIAGRRQPLILFCGQLDRKGASGHRVPANLRVAFIAEVVSAQREQQLWREAKARVSGQIAVRGRLIEQR